MVRCYLILDLFSIHFRESKVAENTSKLLSIYIASVLGIVEFECIFYLVILC